jgi:predicted dehydrogenase
VDVVQHNCQQNISRRKFVKHATAAAMLPTIVSPRVFGANAPSNQITLGLIGTGIHGSGWNLDGFKRCKDARVLAVCDVMHSRREATCAKVNHHYRNQDCTAHADWRDVIARKDIDAVMISTPDHWHVPMAAAASKVGKDVCCEKPTLTIAEGRALIGIIRKNETVFQTSTEDRSIPVYHRMAELVRNGRIGRLQTIRVTLPEGGVPPEKPELAPVPQGFDYDMWLGPAPEAPYCTNRCGAQQWRNILDYSGGKFTDWGAHMLDTAQWANDTERTTPVEVDGKGVFPDESSIYTAANKFKLRYKYANGVDLYVSSGGTGIRMEGTDGWLDIPAWRKPLMASSPEILKSVIGPDETHLFTCPQGEHRNFLDCVRSRKDPYFPVEIGHAMATLMHIGNISMRLDRPLKWNPDEEAFVNDAEADKMLSREMRKPWTL